MTTAYRAPRLLEPSHVVDGFACRSEEQTVWLRSHARQASSSGTSRVLVVTAPRDVEVVAYYGWAMASLAVADAPLRLRKGAGRYPQPVALLTRLGVSVDHEGRGIGAGLLADVTERTARLGTEIGCRGLVVHAETAEAAEFYQHLVPEFQPSRTDDLHLVLLMKDLHRTLRS